jgi:hypothetical protein
MQVAPAYGELPVARDEEEIAPEISRASEWLDDVGVCESASSSPHWPRKAIHEGTVLSDSVHDITDQNSAATSAIVVGTWRDARAQKYLARVTISAWCE